MTNYEAIFKRRSVRVFDETPLSEQALEDIRRYIKHMKPLYRHIRTKIKIIDNNKSQKFFGGYPPHFAVLFSEDKASQNMNAGYLIEQLSLYLTTLGLGSCIVASITPRQEILAEESGKYIIMLMFGKPAMDYIRDDNRQFIRKSKDNILISGEYDDVIEACRLAPSGKNEQPWKLMRDGDRIHVYSRKEENPKRTIYQTLDSIDMGILLYHLETAGRQNKMDGIFEFSPDGAKHAPEDYYYILTMS